MGFVNSLHRLDREGWPSSEHNRKLQEAALEVASEVAKNFPWKSKMKVELVDLPGGYRVARSEEYRWFGFGVVIGETAIYFGSQIPGDIPRGKLPSDALESVDMARRFAKDIAFKWIDEVTQFIDQHYGFASADKFYSSLRKLS